MTRSRILHTVLPFFMLFFFTEVLSSQIITDDCLIDESYISSMEYYLDAADMESERQHWLNCARFGMECVISSWEKDALLFAGEEYDISILKSEAEGIINDIVDERFAEWLEKDFLADFAQPSTGLLAKEIDRLNRLYLYEEQPDGSFDYRTAEGYDDIFIIESSGQSTVIEKGEKTLWEEGIKSKIEDLIMKWSEKMTTDFSELKTSVDDEKISAALEDKFEKDFKTYSSNYRDQLYRLYNLEQSIFTKMRLYDKFSLQYESSQQTASNISEKIITETQDELNSRFEALINGLNAQTQDVKTGGGIINADDWHESFAELLEQGMMRWDEAEQNMLIERIEWEQEAGVDTADGEQVWADAFYELRTERAEWITEFRETLDEGSSLWAEECEELEEAIDKAISEIDENIAESEASLQGRIDNMTGMLLQSVNMMRTARSSWEYWMDRFDEGGKGSFDSADIDFSSESMRDAMAEIKAYLSEQQKNEDPAYCEAGYWLELFESYGNYAREAQTSLAETYGIVVFDNPSFYSAIDEGRLADALLDDSILNDSDAWEAVYLDDYQVELLNARAYMQYWMKQQEIAQAVYDYASDNTSTKESAEQTLKRLNDAKYAYDEVLNDYTENIDRLLNISSGLAEIQTDMTVVQAEIDDYQQLLSDAQDEYNRTITDLQVDNPQYLAEQYRDYYLKLLKLTGMNPVSAEDADEKISTPAERLETYLSAAAEYNLESSISLVSKNAIELLSGEQDTDLQSSGFNTETASLSELRSRMLITRTAGFSSEKTADIDGLFYVATGDLNSLQNYMTDELMLEESDYYYGKILEYYNLYSEPEAENHSEIVWRMQRIADEIRRGCELSYELRLAELKLITANDFTLWSNAYFNGDSPEDILNFKVPADMDGVIRSIDRDIYVYQSIIDKYENSESDEFFLYDWENSEINGSASLSDAQATQMIWDCHKSDEGDSRTAEESIKNTIDLLQKLSLWLVALESLDDCESEIEASLLNPDETLGQQYLKEYLDGRYNLRTDDEDLHLYIYADEYYEESFKIALQQIFKQNMENVPSIAAYYQEYEKAELIETLVKLNLLDSESKDFISPELVWENCNFRKLNEVIDFSIYLNDELSALSVPSYLSEILYGYYDELKNYLAVKAAESFSNEFTENSLSINTEINEQTVLMSRMNTVIRTLQTDFDDCVKLAAVADNEGLSDEIRQEAERRLIETAGFDLAAEALKYGSFSISETYLNGISDAYKAAAVVRAEELYELACALENPETVIVGSEPDEFWEIYNAMLWNSLDFNAAAENIIGENNSVNIAELEELKIITELMPDSKEGFPSDLELQWLYYGNSFLQELDLFILNGKPLSWASDSFSVTEAVKDRYFTAEQVKGFENMTVVSADSVKELWNEDFRDAASTGRIDDVLKSFIVLCFIHDAMNISGVYTDEYGFSEMLEDFTSGMSLEAEALALFECAESDRDNALEKLLIKNSEKSEELLSGEALFWNTAWKLRTLAMTSEYTPDAARAEYIFENSIEAGIVSSWLDSVDNDFDAFSAEIERLFMRQIPEIKKLAGMRNGEIYADIAACNLAAALVEQHDYNISEASEFTNWFCSFNGIDRLINDQDLNSYLSVPAENRLYELLKCFPDEARHYLKKQIISGMSSSELDSVLDVFSGFEDDVKSELLLMIELRDDLAVYNKTVHGDFNNFLDMRYDNEEIKRRQREIYMRFMASPYSEWDDPVFYDASPGYDDATIILEDIEYNRTRGSNTNGINPQCAVSANDVFFNEVLDALNEILYTDEDSVYSELVELQAEKDLLNRDTDDGKWRSYLNAEYLSSSRDDLNLVPLETAEIDDDDYKRCLHINTGDEHELQASTQEFSSLTLFRGTGSDYGNTILDYTNSYLDAAAMLTAAVNRWGYEGDGCSEQLKSLNGKIVNEDDEDFWHYLDNASYSDLTGLYLYKADEVASNRFNESFADFYGALSEIDALKDAMSETGLRRESLIRLSYMRDEQVIAELEPLSEKITMLEMEIENSQMQWQRLMDGDDGYRALEERYAEVYSQAKESAAELDSVKHEYTTARAVYDYASSGYLSCEEEIFTDNDEQALENSLLDIIDKVSPAERLSYVNEKMTRASAAYDVLNSIISNNKDSYSVYEKDEVYRGYFDAYLKNFRESLVLNKINLVMNKATAEQEDIVQDALTDLNKSLQLSYGSISIGDEGLTVVPAGLEDCYIEKSKNGIFEIRWDDSRDSDELISDAEIFKEYFLEGYESDLLNWLEQVSIIQQEGTAQALFTEWGMARKWETLNNGTDAQKELLENEIDEILNYNQEEDLDRSGAEALLKKQWEKAFNKVCSYGADKKELYNFYKLLDKAGLMTKPINNILAKEDGRILANQYMAEKYHEGASDMMIASIPMFASAALYYALGAVAMTVPVVGWIQAAVLFAVAVSFTMGGSLLVGESKSKTAAAEYIETEVISPAEDEIERLLIDYEHETENILAKKKIYEDEYAKLQEMIGEEEALSLLGDDERIEVLKAAVEGAFINEGEDLQYLLSQAGISSLDSLLNDYQNRLGDRKISQCTTGSMFISAFENEAQDCTQIAALELNNYLTGSDGAAVLQAEAEEDFRTAYYRYLKNEINLAEYEKVVEEVWAAPAFSVREHMLRLYEEQDEITELIMGEDQFSADISFDLIESQKNLLTGNGENVGIYDYRMRNYRDIRMHEMQIMKLEMNENRKLWENRMKAISARGELEWSAGELKLNRSYNEWINNIQRDYNRQKAAWNDKYIDFITDKQGWLDAVTVQSTKTGDMRVLENFGVMTNSSVAAAGKDVIVSDLIIQNRTPDEIIDSVIDFDLLGILLDNADQCSVSIADADSHIFTAAAMDEFNTAESLQKIMDFQNGQNEEYETHIAELEFELLAEQIEDAERDFIESIEAANKNTESYLHNILRSGGYIRSGNCYQKQLVAGSTIGGYIYKEGYVSVYKDFTDTEIDFNGEISSAQKNIGNMDADGIKAIVARVKEKIKKQLSRIFGDDEDTNDQIIADIGLSSNYNEENEQYEVSRNDISESDDSGILQSIAEYILELLPESNSGADEYALEQDEHIAYLSPGLFGEHIGYAPVFSDNADLSKEWSADGQFKYEGLGQMGIIMGEYIFNRMIEAAGWSEVNMPHYKKRIWDDSDSFIKAPNMAEIASMAVSVCTMGAGSGLSALMTAGVNLTDDLIITAFDVGTGNKTFLEGAVNFGRTAVSSMLSAGINSELDSLIPSTAGEEILAGVGQQFANNQINGAVNSINYDDESGWCLDLNAYEQSVFGRNALAGYAGGAVGSASTAGLNAIYNNIDFQGFTISIDDINHRQIGRVTSMAGSIIGEAAGAVIDGDIALNVLNLADVMALAGYNEDAAGNESKDMGLIELHFGIDEDNGFQSYSRIGTAGAAISYRDILFDADAVFGGMYRVHAVNEDINAAVVNREFMLGTEGRLLDSNDITFQGASDAAEELASQLEDIRSGKSFENLITMFETASDNDMRYLDTQLQTAIEQGDVEGVRVISILKNQAFNTTGSYKLAEEFFDGERKLTDFADAKLSEYGFSSGEYIKKQYENGTEGILEDVFGGITKWFTADENGSSIAGRANSLLGGNVFDAEAHITEMLYTGSFSDIENNLLMTGGFSQTLNDAMQSIVDDLNGTGKPDLVNQQLQNFAAGLADFENYLKAHPEISLNNLEIDGFNNIENTYYDENSGYYFPFSVNGPDDCLYIFTRDGYDFVDGAEAAATGRAVGSLRLHNAIDVGMRVNGTGSRYHVAAEDMAVTLNYNEDGLWVNCEGESISRDTTHNTARTLELLTRTLLAGNGLMDNEGLIHIDAGNVIGSSGVSSNDFDGVTGPSSGPHSHEITYGSYSRDSYDRDTNWLSETFENFITVTRDASIFSGINDSSQMLNDEYSRVKYLWDNREVNPDYFEGYMQYTYGIENADWQDYEQVAYWQNYNSYMYERW